jgi:actin-like ATPase involved in cell morphogenesis
MTQAIHAETQMIVNVTDDPLTAVVRGTGIVLDDLRVMKNVLVMSTEEQAAKI